MGESKRKEETKQELFQREPEKFHHEEELVLAVKKQADGRMAVLINGDRRDIECALSKITFNSHRMFAIMDHEEAKQKQGGIITPGGNGKRFQ